MICAFCTPTIKSRQRSDKILDRVGVSSSLALNKLKKDNDVHLMWAPGHSGIEGNERANFLK